MREPTRVTEKHVASDTTTTPETPAELARLFSLNPHQFRGRRQAK